MTIKTPYFPMSGGLQLGVPALAMAPGALLGGVNFESAVDSGYRRINGFERFDGQPKPHKQTYWKIPFTLGGTEPSVGNTIDGGTSGASGILVIAATVESGSWAGGDAEGYLIVSQVSGDFDDSEDLEVSAAKFAETNGETLKNESDTDTEHETRVKAAWEYARDQINEIPGEGAILGAAIFEGDVYAWRNKSGGATAGMYKATATGWVEQDLGQYFEFVNGTYIYSAAFSSGSTEPTAGQTLVGATSGAKARFLEVSVTSGSWFTSDAAGIIYLAANTGTAPWNTGGENVNIEGGATNILTLDVVPAEGDFLVDGDVITGHTSSETATVKTVQVTSGRLDEDSGAGIIVVGTSVSGPWTAGEEIDLGGIEHIADLKAATSEQDITLSPDGRYETIVHNFYGHASSRALYGVSGVQEAFEFRQDGAYTPIYTGMTTDTPDHITEHRQHLFLCFDGGSVQHSSTGIPLEWQVVTGAAELATGGEVVGFGKLAGGLLAIISRNRRHVLYGTSIADWELSELEGKAGGIEWTVQDIGSPRFLDDRGMTEIFAVQEFGNFRAGTFSQAVDKLLKEKKERGYVPSASVRLIEKDQYRLFFDDGTGLIARFIYSSNGQRVEFIPMDYDMTVGIACSGEDSDGIERAFFANADGSDGYLYEMDVGNNFDGASYISWWRNAYYHYKSPRQKKRFREVSFDIKAESSGSFQFGMEFEYGGDVVPEGLIRALTMAGGGGLWEEADYWAEFNWSGQLISSVLDGVDGVATNAAMFVYIDDDFMAPVTFQGAVVTYSPLGRSKGG